MTTDIKTPDLESPSTAEEDCCIAVETSGFLFLLLVQCILFQKISYLRLFFFKNFSHIIILLLVLESIPQKLIPDSRQLH